MRVKGRKRRFLLVDVIGACAGIGAQSEGPLCQILRPRWDKFFSEMLIENRFPCVFYISYVIQEGMSSPPPSSIRRNPATVKTLSHQEQPSGTHTHHLGDRMATSAFGPK